MVFYVVVKDSQFYVCHELETAQALAHTIDGQVFLMTEIE